MTKKINFIGRDLSGAVGPVSVSLEQLNLLIENAITKSFEELGLSPRKGQREVIHDVMYSFLGRGKTDVVVSAPTGVGKSVIGAVVAGAMGYLLANRLSGVMLTATNTLSEQYENTFGAADYLTIKGAANYRCAASESLCGGKTNKDGVAITAEMCFVDDAKTDAEKAAVSKCAGCEFRAMKQSVNRVKFVSTNYSWYFTDVLYTKTLEHRAVTVFDEAHLLNDLYAGIKETVLTERTLDALSDTIKKVNGREAFSVRTAITNFKNKLSAHGKAFGDSYVQWFGEFASLLNSVAGVMRMVSVGGDISAEDQRMAWKTQMSLARRAIVIKEVAMSSEVVYGYDEGRKTHYLKPVFIGTDSKSFATSDYRLFLSATVTDKFLEDTLKLNPSTTHFIKVDAAFPPSNKPIVFYKPMVLTFKTLQKQETVSKLCCNVADLVERHCADRNERGLLLTPSFSLQSRIVDHLRNVLPGVELVVQEPGMKQSVALALFKSVEGPCVLVSPSMYEGVDLHGELSRFQIVVKTPYASLGDARMNRIARDYGRVYDEMTLMKLVQGAGRSVRSEEDYAITYFLDTAARRLVLSLDNVWRSEFTYYTE